MADWVCPASTAAGYPRFTDTEEAEYGYHNLAVFDDHQIGKIAQFLARLDPEIPYALLAFRPSFEMTDLGSTTRSAAERALSIAKAAGLTRVRLGNLHLLR